MRKLFSLLFSLVLHCLPVSANPIIILTPNNTINLRGPIGAQTTTDVQMQINRQVVRRGLRNYPLFLVLDSPGGSIDAGNMIIQFAKHVRNLHTISIFSASMASAIVEQLPGQRLVTANGTLMFHKAYAGAEGTVEVGSLEQRLYWIKKQVLALELGNASRMQASLADYKNLISNELWLDADDSIRYRAADNIVDIVCTPALIEQNTQTGFETIFGTVNLTFSSCPLFRVPVKSSNDKLKYVFGQKSIVRK